VKNDPALKREPIEGPGAKTSGPFSYPPRN
jgi:hypothetical protein